MDIRRACKECGAEFVLNDHAQAHYTGLRLSLPKRCKPCRQKRSLKRDAGSPIECEVCRTPMTRRGGYGDTGMCGPCATGESDTLDERGETW